MGDKIRIGVIGCRVGRTWVAGAKAGEDTTAWAVADLNQELAQQVAADNGVSRVYGDYRENCSRTMKWMRLESPQPLMCGNRWYLMR